MSPRPAGESLFAPRLGAFLAVWALALAGASNARAGCAGLAHGTTEAQAATLVALSPELLEDALVVPSRPLKPAGCNGAFCSKPYQSPGTDFSGGVDLRAEHWAHATAWAAPRDAGREPLHPWSERSQAVMRRDVIFHPPR